jgi:hypothetical protein
MQAIIRSAVSAPRRLSKRMLAIGVIGKASSVHCQCVSNSKTAPVLVAIHSSLVSISFSRSPLLSTASGTLLPLPVILHPRCPAAALICMAHR